MNNPLNVALISFAHGHQHDYGGQLARHPHTNLVAVAEYADSPDAAKQAARHFAAEHNVPYFDDYRDMLAAHELHAVSVAVPPEVNVEVVEALVARNVAVLCEKPIADTPASIDRIVAAVRNADITFTFAAPATVFSSAFRPAIAEVEAGAIGSPRVAYFQFLQPRGPQYTLPPERCAQVDRAELANFGPYGALALLKLLKQPIVSVFARSDALFYEHYRQHNLDDMAVLSVQLAGGCIATMVIGRTTTQTLPATDCRMQVIGSEGVINIEHGLGYALDVYAADAHRRVPYDRTTTELFVDDFVAAVQHHRPPLITLDDAVQVTRFIDAAYESAKTGQVVQIN